MAQMMPQILQLHAFVRFQCHSVYTKRTKIVATRQFLCLEIY